MMNGFTVWVSDAGVYLRNNNRVVLIVFNGLVYVTVSILSYIYGFAIEPNFQEFSPYDIRLQHSYVPEASITIPGWLLALFAVGLPTMNSILVIYMSNIGGKRLFLDFELSLFGIIATEMAIVSVLKNICGMPRPDMISRCVPSLELVEELALSNIDICTSANYEVLKDGFRSFPSLHSSTSTLTTLFNWRMFKFLDNRDTFGRSLFFKSFITMIPIILALYVSTTRIKDNRHFLVDIVVGGSIGAVTAVYYYVMLKPAIPIPKRRALSIEQTSLG